MIAAIELGLHRANTLAFIAAKPSLIVLTPVSSRQRTVSGGWETVPGAPRPAQVFRIIELGMQASPPVLKLQDGTQRELEFWLLGEYDAEVAIGDHWTSDDGREWEVGDIVRSNNYETRALVAERGR